MAKRRYEYCAVCGIRAAVAERLVLPAYKGPKGQNEAPTEFWSRVERAGLLVKALALYDRLAAEGAARVHTRLETKKAFAERVEKEGRRPDAERVRAELLASGLSQRQAQEELVARFQPLDGSATRAWTTPDPWQAGRLFRKKAEQDSLLRWEDTEDHEFRGLLPEVAEARRRVKWAKHRQEERGALAAARRRTQALKAAASNGAGVAPLPSQPVPPPVAASVPAPTSAEVPAQREERQPAKAAAPSCPSSAPTHGEMRGGPVCPPPVVGRQAPAPAKAALASEPAVAPHSATVRTPVVCRYCGAAPSAPGYAWCATCLSGHRVN